MDDIPSWHIVGDWFDNCSCAVPCPCTFAQAPDYGFCESDARSCAALRGYERDIISPADRGAVAFSCQGLKVR
jgi:hypothetical protein